MHRLIQPTPRLGRIACRMLCIELPLVLLAAVVLLISYLAAAEADPVLAALRFGEAPVTVFASPCFRSVHPFCATSPSGGTGVSV